MSATDIAKLLGVLGLTKKQQEYLHIAAVLEWANGYIYARASNLRHGFRVLELLTLLRRRAANSPVYDLTPLGREIATFLGTWPDNVDNKIVTDGNI